jgi:O-methyltransferase
MNGGIQQINATTQDLYLDLLQKCLTRQAFGGAYAPVRPPLKAVRHKALWALYPLVRHLLARRNLELVRPVSFDPLQRMLGKDCPAEAETMIGQARLENLKFCVTDVLERDVPGDLVETGVWRGGASIFMRALLKAHGDTQRSVWLADSFEGMPKPDLKRYPQDGGGHFQASYWKMLAVSLDEVKANFARYGLLDEQVRFLPGWFRDTLPNAPIGRLAVMRLDGDMYGSTMDALENLYPKLSIGGYIIIDDYGAFRVCKQAVHDFRAKYGIIEEIVGIDWTGVFWQRRH